MFVLPTVGVERTSYGMLAQCSVFLLSSNSDTNTNLCWRWDKIRQFSSLKIIQNHLGYCVNIRFTSLKKPKNIQSSSFQSYSTVVRQYLPSIISHFWRQAFQGSLWHPTKTKVCKFLRDILVSLEKEVLQYSRRDCQHSQHEPVQI